MDEAVARLNVELGAANARGKIGTGHVRKVIGLATAWLQYGWKDTDR